MNTNKTINHEQIKQLIAHRYPMLLVDRVIDYELAQSMTAIKNVSANEPQFQGHFPAQAIFPGVLIIEAMAQVTGILGSVSAEQVGINKNDLYYLVAVDKCRFRRMVVPGDMLQLHVQANGKPKRGMWRFDCQALVHGKIAAEASIMCASSAT